MHNGDGSSREENGSVTLRNDSAARGFDRRVIREMTNDNWVQYAGWTMDVASGERAVCSLVSFNCFAIWTLHTGSR
jgi:hypothetical protein